MRHTEFWARLDEAMGPLSRHWAATHVLSALGGRTVEQALADGEPAKQVWRVVWEDRGLPERDR